MEVIRAGDAGEFQRALHHAERRVAVAVHDAVREGTVVRADADGAAEFLAELHQRRELFLDAPELLDVLLVGVFLDGEFLRVGVVAGIDADHLHPFGGFHRGIGLEVDVGDDRDQAAALAKFSDDVLQVRRVLHGGRGDADDLAADGDEVERLLDGSRRVHRVAGEHRLHDDRATAAQNHAAAGGIAHDDFAGLASMKHKR